MEQGALKVKFLPANPHHLEAPQYLRQEHPPLHPRHLPAQADPRTKTERMQALQVVTRERGVVERMVGGQPPLRPEAQWFVEVRRVPAESPDAALYVCLQSKGVSGWSVGWKSE